MSAVALAIQATVRFMEASTVVLIDRAMRDDTSCLKANQLGTL
jgi:hypothetical protein